MKLWKLNPFVRNALHFLYKPRGYPVYIADFHIIYVDNGEMNIRCSGKDMHLPKGSLIHIPAGSVYELYLPSGQDELPLLAVVDFDLTQSDNSYKKIKYPTKHTDGMPCKAPTEIAELSDISEDDSFLSEIHIFENAQYLRYLMIKLIEEFRNERPLYRELCSCIMKEIIINLHRALSSKKSDMTTSVDSLKRYLEANFTDHIDNASLAGRFGYHVNSLERLFRQSTGTTIRQYVLSLRLAEAKRLLGETGMPISDIARTVGFGNYSYFSDYFRVHVGMSPAAYRKQLQNIV